MAFLSSWAVPLAAIVGSVLYRASRGKPVLFFGVPNASFQERNASGHSKRSLLSRLGGARNCLVVAVTGDRVVIRPWFPFTLLFLPEIYNLEFEFRVQDIVAATNVDSLLGKRVELTFRNSSGEAEVVSLRLRNPERFLESLGRPLGVTAVVNGRGHR